MKVKEVNVPKLVFHTKTFSDNRNCRVRLTEEAAGIINEIYARTAVSATEIVSAMIVFASKYTVIEPSCFETEADL